MILIVTLYYITLRNLEWPKAHSIPVSTIFTQKQKPLKIYIARVTHDTPSLSELLKALNLLSDTSVLKLLSLVPLIPQAFNKPVSFLTLIQNGNSEALLGALSYIANRNFGSPCLEMQCYLVLPRYTDTLILSPLFICLKWTGKPSHQAPSIGRTSWSSWCLHTTFWIEGF